MFGKRCYILTKSGKMESKDLLLQSTTCYGLGFSKITNIQSLRVSINYLIYVNKLNKKLLGFCT
jgi:hypothetical protein